MKNLLIVLFALCGLFAKAADTTTLTIQVAGGSKFSPINVVDKVTGAYIAATVTDVTVQNLNPDLATVAPNEQYTTTIQATAIKAGKGIAVVNCHVSYVDPGDGLPKSEDLTIIISYTVIAAPHGARLQLNFF